MKESIAMALLFGLAFLAGSACMVLLLFQKMTAYEFDNGRCKRVCECAHKCAHHDAHDQVHGALDAEPHRAFVNGAPSRECDAPGDGSDNDAATVFGCCPDEEAAANKLRRDSGFVAVEHDGKRPIRDANEDVSVFSVHAAILPQTNHPAPLKNQEP